MSNDSLTTSLIDHHKHAERLFCAASFISPDIAKQECGWLDSVMFYDTNLRKYWQSIKDGSDPAKAAIDAGIYSDIMKWMTDVSSTDVNAFARTIADDHFLVSAANHISDMARAIAERDVNALRNTVAEMQKNAPDMSDSAMTATDVGLEFNQTLYDIPDVVLFGFGALDNATGGIDKQTLTLLVGRPSMGKSTLALQLARNAVAQKKRVLFFAIEQARKMLWRKMACGKLGYDYSKIKLGKATDDEKKKLGLVTGELIEQYGDLLLIDDRTNITSDQIWSSVAKHRPEMFIVDHIGRVSDNEENEVNRLGIVSAAGKDIAKEMNCCAVYVTQLNRAVEGRDNKVPTMADLRGSGKLEENADIVMSIYRQDYYDNRYKDINARSETQIDILKYRDGMLAQAFVDFIPSRQWFYPKGERE